MSLAITIRSDSPATSAAEVHRYFSPKHYGLVSVRDDGVTWLQGFDGAWTVLLRKKPEKPMEAWLAFKQQIYAALQPWQRNVQRLPDPDEFEEWAECGTCGTPTGHEVEPDGEGPDGVPTWLRLFGLV